MVVDRVGGVGRHGDAARRHDGEVGDHPFRPVLGDQRRRGRRAPGPARASRAPARSTCSRASRQVIGPPGARRSSPRGTAGRPAPPPGRRTWRQGWGRFVQSMRPLPTSCSRVFLGNAGGPQLGVNLAQFLYACRNGEQGARNGQAGKRRGAKTRHSAPCREWDLADLYPGRDSAELTARPRRERAERQGLSRALSGQARGAVGRRARRARSPPTSGCRRRSAGS